MSQTAAAPQDDQQQRHPRPRAPQKRVRPIAYESAGPERLAKTPSKAPKQPQHVHPDWQVLKNHIEPRINMLRSWRASWLQHWTILETYILPRRGIFIGNSSQPLQNAMIRGAPINDAIVDPTGTYAMRRCAAGLMSNEMSPSRQWFKLKPALFSREEAQQDAKEWFEVVEDRMSTVMGRSNFYQECAQVFEDLVTFGTGPLIIYEDEQDLIRCYTPCCGEYMCASSSANRVETFGRLFVMTISAIVEMFGLENCPRDIQKMWEEKGGGLEVEKIVAHLIEPNSPIFSANGGDVGVVPGGFAWREVYWIYGSSQEYPLSMTGFVDQPHIVPRWAVTSNDAYGRSPGMDVLPDIVQLQVETARKAEALEKQVRPPMVGSVEMKNEPASILPGKVTYVAKLGPDVGFKPAFEVRPVINELMQDLQAIQLRIREGFFNDLFQQLEQVNKTMTAYEVAARNQEKLQILGPVVERLQNEMLAPAIKRIFRIMERKGLLPPLPPSLRGITLGIEYVGVLALAAKAAKTATLERWAQTMNAQAQIHPEANDIWDFELWSRKYAEDLFMEADLLRSKETVAAMAAARAKAMQQQQALAAAQSAAKTGQMASGIDVGGGMNAVQMMTGLGGNSPGAGGPGGAQPGGPGQ